MFIYKSVLFIPINADWFGITANGEIVEYYKIIDMFYRYDPSNVGTPRKI